MALYLSPVCNDQQFDANGNPLVGGKVYTYLAGTTTPAATYTDSTGATPQANPIVLNSLGLPASPIWLTGGVTYKLVVKTAADVTLRTVDNVSGINDVSSAAQEWNESGFVPTYLNATQFSVPGDQTATLQVNRRIRCRVTAGTAYGRISACVFSAGITTVTVVMDSIPVDSGLTSLAYGFLGFSPSSIPYALYAGAGANTDITSMSGLVGAGLFPVGGLYVHTGSTAPNGYIKANGALLSRSAYSGLWAFAQASGNLASSDGVWTNGQYSPGDGSTTFRIPDLRAEFIRMWDDGRGIDAGRTFGSLVLDAMQGHAHQSSAASGATGSAAAGGGNPVATQGTVTGSPVTDGTNGTPRTAAETRPRSVAYLPCIKY